MVSELIGASYRFQLHTGREGGHPSLVLGLFGKPFIDLSPLLPSEGLPELHEEICLGLSQVPLDYTGGSHRSMGIMPAARREEAVADYGEVIRAMTPAEVETFRSLAERPEAIALQAQLEDSFGEERAIPLSRRQMMWLQIRFGVYFPWKGYVELIPNRSWEGKADPNGKRFTRLALSFFPKTVQFVKSLPFEHIGRCNIMGVFGNDYGTVHRDGDPAEQQAPDEFITFCPNGDKRLFLYDEERALELPIDSRFYWFNDFDYHGVERAPHFRYSVRVDGVFTAEFRERIMKQVGQATS